MILCPNCHHEEIEGALFCSECGAQLVSTKNLTTQTIGRSPSGGLGPTTGPIVPPSPPTASTGVDSVLSLHLLDSGQIIHLAGRTEFSLGRVTEGQPILPDVDLSPYEAYSMGVSRLHAGLKIANQRLMVTDLGSSNGTRVNGQKIMPHLDYPLNHGDILALGKLKIQVLIRK